MSQLVPSNYVGLRNSRSDSKVWPKIPLLNFTATCFFQSHKVIELDRKTWEEGYAILMFCQRFWVNLRNQPFWLLTILIQWKDDFMIFHDCHDVGCWLKQLWLELFADVELLIQEGKWCFGVVFEGVCAAVEGTVCLAQKSLWHLVPHLTFSILIIWVIAAPALSQ